MGVTVYINGSYYWFKNIKELIALLEENCNDKGPSEDDALNIEFREE